MKSLIFVVEGETEEEFVNRLLAPYLIEFEGLNTEIRAVLIEMSGGGHGYSNIEHLKNTIQPLLHKVPEPVITTFIDYYGINSERKMPGYTSIVTGDAERRIAHMQETLNEEVQKIKSYRYFIPYIQQHEMETLLFVNPEEGFDLEDKKIKDEVVVLCGQFESIEDINCTPTGAPSKRLEQIYQKHHKKYNKVVDAVDIIELSGGIPAVLSKCPRFAKWITRVVSMVKESG